MVLHRALAAILSASVVTASGVRPAFAQTDSTKTTSAELGASAGVIFFLPVFGARVALPIQPRLAVEAVGEVMPINLDEGIDSTWLLFQIQVRQLLARGRVWRMHATYGTTFGGRYTHSDEVRQTRPDGSVVVLPEYRRLEVHTPTGVHAGVGGDRPVSRHVAVRWDVQILMSLSESVIPVPRATAGVSWRR